METLTSKKKKKSFLTEKSLVNMTLKSKSKYVIIRSFGMTFHLFLSQSRKDHIDRFCLFIHDKNMESKKTID
jgi:hypothetical protein